MAKKKRIVGGLQQVCGLKRRGLKTRCTGHTCTLPPLTDCCGVAYASHAAFGLKLPGRRRSFFISLEKATVTEWLSHTRKIVVKRFFFFLFNRVDCYNNNDEKKKEEIS